MNLMTFFIEHSFKEMLLKKAPDKDDAGCFKISANY